jgi:hypothetical protein
MPLGLSAIPDEKALGAHATGETTEIRIVLRLPHLSALSASGACLSLIESQLALHFLWQTEGDEAVGVSQVVLELVVGKARLGVVLDPLHAA